MCMQALRDTHTAGQRFSWPIRPAIAGISLLGLAVVAEVLGDHWWLFDLANHFRIQTAWGLALVLGAFLIARRWRAAMIAAALLALQIALCAPALTAPIAQPADKGNPGRTIRVMTLNVWARKRQYESVVELIRRESPDLIVLEEIDGGWRDSLESLKADWPHQEMVLDGGHFGIALLSRIPFVDARIERISGEIPAIVAEVHVNGVPLSVCGVHLTRPTSRAGAERQARQYDQLIERLAGEPLARIVLGDFNATPWTRSFARFCERSGLRNSRSGFGILPSWPAFVPGVLRIPIDHCLISPAIEVRQIRIGPPVGSDHLPVVVDLLVAMSHGDF